MKPQTLLIATVLSLSCAAWATSKEMTGRAWLQEVPPLPGSAQAAYAQWVDNNGSLDAGAGFKAIDDGLTNVAKDQTEVAAASPQVQQQMAMARQMQQQFGSPEGQAKLHSMSTAELMAMAQQMQGPSMMSGPVSAHDQALMGRISGFTGVVQEQMQIQKARSAQIALEQQWDTEKEALDKLESQERAALPVCHDEAGEPSDIAVRGVALKYADLRIALATKYLPRFQPSVDQLRAAILPRIDYGDSAMVAWAQLENPALKQQYATVARSAENAALGDVGVMQAFVKEPSKRAAQAVADKKNTERVYANAKGC